MATFNQLNVTVTDLQARIKNYEAEISDRRKAWSVPGVSTVLFTSMVWTC